MHATTSCNQAPIGSIQLCINPSYCNVHRSTLLQQAPRPEVSLEQLWMPLHLWTFSAFRPALAHTSAMWSNTTSTVWLMFASPKSSGSFAQGIATRMAGRKSCPFSGSSTSTHQSLSTPAAQHPNAPVHRHSSDDQTVRHHFRRHQIQQFCTSFRHHSPHQHPTRSNSSS